MKIVAIIPARMQATRFPGKPLKPILGLPMIEHVRRRVLLCKKFDQVIVATCDQEIKETVEKAGGQAVMTADTYERCTDRIAEAAQNLDADVIVNVQGDEPLVMPEDLEKVVDPFFEDSDLPCVNLVTPIKDDEEFNNPNAPKVVMNCQNEILYISREPIPSIQKTDRRDYRRLKQLGIIAFKKEFLQTFTQLSPTLNEEIESVDMMRAIDHGYRLKAISIDHRMIGVDVPGDIPCVEEILKNDVLFKTYCGE